MHCIQTFPWRSLSHTWAPGRAGTAPRGPTAPAGPALLDFQHLLHHARTPRGKGHLQQEQVGAFQNEQGQLLGAAHAVEEAHLRPHEEGRELLGPVKEQLVLCTLPPPEEVPGALLGGVEVRRGRKELDSLPGQAEIE